MSQGYSYPALRFQMDSELPTVSDIGNFVVDSDSGNNKLILPPYGNRCSAKNFNIDRTTVLRIWHRAKQNFEIDGAFHVSPRKKGRCGRKKPYNPNAMAKAIEALPSNERKTLRQISGALGVSLCVVQQSLHGENSFIMAHTNSIKPYLTEANKYARVCFALDRVVKKQQDDGALMYSNCFDSIHVDKKWFFLTEEENMRYYTTRKEEQLQGKQPKGLCTHKSHILKVMFLAAVARPRSDNNGMCTFDGKIGKSIAAKRSSNRCAKGMIETKPVSVKRDNYLQMMIEKVLSAIHEKFPNSRSRDRKNLHMQHDNALVHFDDTNEEWHAASQLDGWSIGLKNQCPNSPDTNVRDLGFFCTLQTEQWKLPSAKTVDELIERVKQAFGALDPCSIDANFLTLQSCFDEIIKHHGGNEYSIPHLGKNKLRTQGGGKLPDALPVSDVTKDAIEVMGFSHCLSVPI
jgi:hypothetical protein